MLAVTSQEPGSDTPPEIVDIPRRSATPTLSLLPVAPPVAPTPLPAVRAAASAELVSSAVAKPVPAEPPIHAYGGFNSSYLSDFDDDDDGGDASYSPAPEIYDSMCIVCSFVLHNHSLLLR